jgi:hypothetical protein
VDNWPVKEKQVKPLVTGVKGGQGVNGEVSEQLPQVPRQI